MEENHGQRPFAQSLSLTGFIHHEPPQAVIPLCYGRVVFIQSIISQHTEAHRLPLFIQAKGQGRTSVLLRRISFQDTLCIGGHKCLLFRLHPQLHQFP